MTDSDILSVRVVEPDDLFDLRRRVLRGGLATAVVEDARDREATTRHFGTFLGERLVTSGSLYPSVSPVHPEHVTYQLRYLATDFDVQGTGAGALLLRAAEGELTSEGVDEIWANGRDTALGFYDAHGWQRVADSAHLSPDTQLPHTVIYKVLRVRDEVTIDFATPEDGADLATLREEMYFSMNPRDWRGPWIARSAEYYAETIRDGSVVATVARNTDGRVVASVVAQLRRVVPTPRYPTGHMAYLHSVSTLPAYRRRGISYSLMELLMPNLDARGLDRMELHATPLGRPLYESFGFSVRAGGTEMRREGAAEGPTPSAQV